MFSSDGRGKMKFQDSCIDIDLDLNDSATCLWSMAIIAFLVGESGEDVAFKSYHKQDSKIYMVSLDKLNEYKRVVMSACLEEQFGGQ